MVTSPRHLGDIGATVKKWIPNVYSNASLFISEFWKGLCPTSIVKTKSRVGVSRLAKDQHWSGRGHTIRRGPGSLRGRTSLPDMTSGMSRKSRHYFANKGPSSQSYGFSSSHIWMWELDYKESWAQNCWFWTVVLEKILESPLDCKEITPVHPKGDHSWIFIGRIDLKLKLQYFGHLRQRADSFEKTLMLRKIEGGKRRRPQRMRWLDGIIDSMDTKLGKLRKWWRTGKPGLLSSME